MQNGAFKFIAQHRLSYIHTMHPMSPVVGDENLYGGVSTLPSSESIAVHEHLKPCARIVAWISANRRNSRDKSNISESNIHSSR